jgi:hypothetical protein
VADNYGTHKHPEVRTWLARPENQRITLQFTPTGCSWLNMVEIFLRDHHPPGHPPRHLRLAAGVARVDEGADGGGEFFDGAEPSWDIGFYQVYADPSGLVAVFATQTGDFWGRPDLSTGELKNIGQWR